MTWTTTRQHRQETGRFVSSNMDYFVLCRVQVVYDDSIWSHSLRICQEGRDEEEGEKESCLLRACFVPASGLLTELGVSRFSCRHPPLLLISGSRQNKVYR